MRNRGLLHHGILGLILASVLTLAPVASMAQEQPSNSQGDVFDDTMNDLYMIGGLGAGGAILGLSTLSFTEHPTQNLKNVWIGGAIGIIVGVGVVAWQQATKSQETLRSGQVAPALTTYQLASAGPATRELVNIEAPMQWGLSFDF
jgi:drug/metabolite transporter (DMT)-like permease